jgi:hypothetical protein
LSFSFAVDPRGIGFAFHGARTTAKENHSAATLQKKLNYDFI